MPISPERLAAASRPNERRPPSGSCPTATFDASDVTRDTADDKVHIVTKAGTFGPCRDR